MADDEKKVGYRNPPTSTRFKKGQSGNLKGRPTNRHRDELPYEHVLGQQVTIIDNGVRTPVSAELAFLQKIAVSGLKGDSAIANDLLMSIEAMQSSRSTGLDDRIERIEVQYVNPDHPNRALELLGIAKPLYRGKPNAHMAIHPKTVEAALERLPDRRFTREEQQIIVAATQTPHKVNWPDWWEVIPPQRR